MPDVVISKKYNTPLVLFIVGLILTGIGMQFPSVRLLLTDIGSAGYIGAFLAGILYGTAFTSSLATVILFKLSHDMNPVWAALIAGLGTGLYDFAVFALFKRQQHHGMIGALRDKIRYHTGALPQWLTNMLGLIVIASPLPDELSAGLLSFTIPKAWQFALISWLANTLGAFFIISMGR
ncbi:MAG: hypothetical protein WC544_02515 [Patescibacteria group bacterium]